MDPQQTPQNPNFDWNLAYSGKAADYQPPDALLCELAGALPPGRALDVGCGAGGLIVALAEAGWQVAGIDIAARAIAAAREVLAERGLDAELAVADATRWQPSAQYDLVVSSFALPATAAGRARAFAAMRAALAPGGTMIIKDFDPSMTRLSFFAGMDLVSVDELTGAFPDLEVIRAAVVDTPVHCCDDPPDGEGGPWTAALFHGRDAVQSPR